MGLLGKKAIATVLLAVFIGTVTAFATPVWAAPPTKAPISAWLSKYHKVNLLVPYPPGPLEPIEIPIGETTVVIHGWVTGGAEGDIPDLPFWSEMNGTQKNEYLKTANFELSIEGTTVELQRFQWYNHQLDGMYVLYYTVFPPNTFAPGDVIQGDWTIEFEGILYSYTATRTVVIPI